MIGGGPLVHKLIPNPQPESRDAVIEIEIVVTGVRVVPKESIAIPAQEVGAALPKPSSS